MRASKLLRPDQEALTRFINVLGQASILLGHSKRARPGFFIVAHALISEYIEGSFFKKIDILTQALEAGGFPAEEGPVAALHLDQTKCRAAAVGLSDAAKAWQAGDEAGRSEVVWAASDFTSAMRQHLERLNHLIHPLLEQTLQPEDEHRIAEGFNKIALELTLAGDPDKHLKQIAMLEEELTDWK
jgi:hemerythrin-like domain-containing protein